MKEPVGLMFKQNELIDDNVLIYIVKKENYNI